MSTLDPLVCHEAMWARMQCLFKGDRLPQALLLIAPRYAHVLAFVHRFMAILLCENPPSWALSSNMRAAPCGVCSSCSWLTQTRHPDVHWVSPDAQTQSIKIEQIRALQQDVYQTPQRGSRRFIVIQSADLLNSSAANAVLKILEEPPSHTMFILTAEQTRTLPMTLMSRCQLHRFSGLEALPSSSSDGPLTDVTYWVLSDLYPIDSPRGQLFQQRAAIEQDMQDVIMQKESSSTIASKWLAQHALEELLWFLQLLIAQLIQARLLRTASSKPGLSSLTPVALFQQWDKINACTRQLQQHVALNERLTIESILTEFIVTKERSG